jgi:RecB family exonuclease
VWRASSGSPHHLAACPPAEPPESQSPANAGGALAAGASQGDTATDDLAPLDAAMDRWSAAMAAGSATADPDWHRGGESDALLGTLVHRLIQRLGVKSPVERAAVEVAARQAVRAGDNVAHQDLPAVVELAADLYARAREHPQIAAILAAPDIWHEVPFSTTDGGRVVRGTIDCIARTGPGQVTVLEFKTGRSRQWHQAQLRVYLGAVERLFPDTEVRAELVYVQRGG